MRLRVTQYGEPILREKGAPVTQFDGELRQLTEDMIETMHAEEGAGLAAQQVDKALQLFVLDFDADIRGGQWTFTLDERTVPLELIMPMVVCNPQIVELGDTRESDGEGCLSFPGIWLDDVERPHAIEMRYQDVEGNPHVLRTNGFFARVCLHEFDHLQGTLFIDRVPKPALQKVESKLKRLKRDSRDYLKGK